MSTATPAVRLPARLLFAAALAFSLGSAAAAQAPGAIAAYDGPDRAQRLAAGAAQEGSLTVYSSTTLDDMTPVIAAFEEKYGIEVELWRANSSDILQRALTEARAGHNAVDVVETGAAEMEALTREGLFQELRSPSVPDLMPEAAIPGRPWIASRMAIYSLAYNTNLVRQADLPRTYAELADPKWRGRLGIESTDSDWFMALAGTLGEDEAVALFRNIVASNRASVRRGHMLLSNLVAAGEIALAVNVYTHEVEGMKRAGAPMAEHFIAPAIAQFAGVGVTRGAPHPHAAALFADFVLSDGQRIWGELKRTPTHLQYQQLPPGIEMEIVDEAKYVDENRRWEALYRDVLSGR